MGKITLKYVGQFQESHQIEVDEKDAKKMIDSGDFETVGLEDKVKAEGLILTPKIIKSKKEVEEDG